MNSKASIIIPALMITVGVGWILTLQGVIPSVDWIWTLGLAAVGFLIYALSGYNKFSVVTGSFFIFASCLSLFRQTGRLSLDMEVPILVITAGVLLLVARSPAIPAPEWIELRADGAKDELAKPR